MTYHGLLDHPRDTYGTARDTRNKLSINTLGAFTGKNTTVPPFSPTPLSDSGTGHPVLVPHQHVISRSFISYAANPLACWLIDLFKPYFPVSYLEGYLRYRGVGTSKLYGGSTLFWQRDEQLRIRGGKIMAYDPLTGKRIKNPRPLMTWVHSLRGTVPEGYELKQYFFGTHVAALLPEATLWLFESEKAALVTHLFLMAFGEEWVQNVVCMAMGGCSNLRPTDWNMNDPADRHYVLRRRRIVLFPDEGKTDEWKQAADVLRSYCPSVALVPLERPSFQFPSLTKLTEMISVTVQEGDGYDDIVLRLLPYPELAPALAASLKG